MTKYINSEVDMTIRLIIASIMFVINLIGYKIPINDWIETFLIVGLILCITLKIGLDISIITEKTANADNLIRIIDLIIFALVMYSINSNIIELGDKTCNIINILIMALSALSLIVIHKNKHSKAG